MKYDFWVDFKDGRNVEVVSVHNYQEALIVAQAERIKRDRNYHNWTKITQEFNYGWETVIENENQE